MSVGWTWLLSVSREPLSLSAVFASSVASSALGVGSAALLPLFVWEFDGKPGVAVFTVYLLFQNISKLALFWREIDWYVGRRLLLWAAPAAAAGSLLLLMLPEAWFRQILGVCILLLITLPALPLPDLPSTVQLPVFGLFYGLCSGALGSGNVVKGPLLLSAGLVKERYIATYALSSLAMNLPKILIYGVGGLTPSHLLGRGALLLVASLDGSWAGKRLLVAIPARWFARVVTGVCVLSALLLLV